MSSEIVFLFGAGASLAAGSTDHVSPETPPLMTQVYGRLARDFPHEWGRFSALAQHADRFRNDFEAAFTEEVLRHELPFASPPTLNLVEEQRTLAIHFARYRLARAGADLYSGLLSYLRAAGAIESTTFGSLNYDTVFEQAAVHAGYSVDWLNAQAMSRLRADAGLQFRPRPQTISIAKLHGSSNFVMRLDRHHRAIAAGSGVRIGGTITTLAPDELSMPGEAERFFKGDDHFPVMSQVSAEKDQLLAPGVISQIRSMWTEAVWAAATVVVIGVSPRKHDSHVWDPIQGGRAKMYYIGSEPDFEIWSSLKPERWRHLGEKWEAVDQATHVLG